MKVVPRVRSEVASGEVTALDSSPHDEMIRSAAQRLALAVAAVGLGHVLYTLLYWLLWDGHLVGRTVGITVAVVSAWVVYAIRRPECRTLSIARLGFGFEIFTCLAMSIVEYWELPPLDRADGKVSWTCMVILLFPILVPARPRLVAVVSTLAATMSPLGFAIDSWLVGHPSIPGPVLLSWFLPEYICAAISVAVASVLGSMGKDVMRARRLGSYELIEPLGEGGMGEVWRAQHQLLVRPAAIKLIKPEGGEGTRVSQGRLERFEREAQATAALASPHTVSLYDFGVSERGELYYVMELLVGLDLDRLVERFGPQPAGRVVHLLQQVCESLDEAHRAGLVHRDIKPANLYACRVGGRCDFVKVLDFGLVRWGAGADDQSPLRTQEGVIKGTPAYLAPEMVAGEEVDGRADLYALGCVAYWLLTGGLVFEATTPMKMALDHAATRPTPPSQRTELPIPERLEAIVLRCLEKDPGSRPQSARELSDELERCLAEAAWSAQKAEAWWVEHLPELVHVDVVRDVRRRERKRSLVPVAS